MEVLPRRSAKAEAYMQTGLTPFLINMMKADRAALAKADVARLAAKYDIEEEWAAWYIRMWLATSA